MDVEAVIVRVRQILVEEFELDEQAVHPEADLRADLNLDSLDGMDLVVLIEKEFSFRIDEKRLMRLRTVGQVYAYVREVCAEAAATSLDPAPTDSL